MNNELKNLDPYVCAKLLEQTVQRLFSCKSTDRERATKARMAAVNCKQINGDHYANLSLRYYCELQQFIITFTHILDRVTFKMSL